MALVQKLQESRELDDSTRRSLRTVTKSIARLSSSGATADRPTTGDFVGQKFLDTTTTREYMWDGTNWLLHGGKLPRVAACKATAQVVATATVTLVTFPDSEDYDTDTIHDLVTNPSRLTVPTGLSGVWRVGFSLYAAANANAGPVQGWITVNGGATRYGWNGSDRTAALDAVLCGTADIPATAGQFFEVNVFQSSGINESFGVVGVNSRFWAHFLYAT